MRIGIDARMYGPQQTGIGLYIKNLIKELLAIDQKNEYRIFLLEREYFNFPTTERARPVKVSASWYGWREQVILPLQFFKEKIDLMHFPHFNAPIFYSAPFVVTIHDLTPKYFPGKKVGASALRRAAFELVLKHSLKKSRKIISVSEYTKNEILKYYPIDSDKIKIIYEGIPIGNSQKAAVDEIFDLKNKYGIKKPFIFYTGVWRNHKNLVGLIRAFDILVNKYNLDIELVLGGKEDPFYPEVRNEWEKLRLETRIICPGFISERELPLFYRAAEIFCIPSFVEGFGFVALEAMIAGTPVAASNAGSLPEIIGNAAAYFDPYDCRNIADVIFSIFDNPDFKNRLLQKGFEQIEKYDWRKMAEQTLEVYRNVLK